MYGVALHFPTCFKQTSAMPLGRLACIVNVEVRAMQKDVAKLSVREGENSRFWKRGQRIYRNTKGFYYKTREGIEVGPFGCRFDAEIDLESMICAITEGGSASQVVHSHAVTAGTTITDYHLNSGDYTDYLVEEGGVELLEGWRASA